MSIIHPAPVTMSGLFKNLLHVITQEDCTLGPELEVIQNKEKAEFLSFLELVKTTEKYYSQFLAKEGSSLQNPEYLSAKLFTRLERIAEKHCNLPREKAHLSMKRLKEINLNYINTKLSSPKRQFFPIEKISDGAEIYYCYQPAHQDQAPFYQESQQRISSCQLHAANAALGYHAVKLSSIENISHNHPDDNSIEIRTINTQLKAQQLSKYIVEIPLSQIWKNRELNEEQLNQYRSLVVNNAFHAYALRKDDKGQWWQIDSYHKVNELVYQNPISLKEIAGDWTLLARLVESEGELKQLIRDDLSGLLKDLESMQSINEVKVLVQKLSNFKSIKLPASLVDKSENFYISDAFFKASLTSLQQEGSLRQAIHDLINDQAPILKRGQEIVQSLKVAFENLLIQLG